MPDIEQLHASAMATIEGAPDGPGLDPLAQALIRLAVCVSVTSLDPTAIRAAIDEARTAGATTDQIQEIVALVSGLGVHSLMASAAMVLDEEARAAPLDEERLALWARHVGEDPYWAGFEAETPGFLDALLRLSPAGFEAFFTYCAVPWSTRHVRAIVKELAALACDAAPTHRFGPGLRIHLRNALALGATRQTLLDTLRLAASAPLHSGVA